MKFNHRELKLDEYALRGLNGKNILKETITIMSMSSKRDQEMTDDLNAILAKSVTTASEQANATHAKLAELTVDKFIKKAHESYPFKIKSSECKIAEWQDEQKFDCIGQMLLKKK